MQVFEHQDYRRALRQASQEPADGAEKQLLHRFAKFFNGMLSRGIYLAPSQFEALFVSLAHGDAAIDATVEAARETLAELADS